MAGQLTIDTLSASSGVLATQNGMTGIAKAWVNFNGYAGAVSRASFNISSVTRYSQGVYGVTFTTAMPDANYVPMLIATPNNNGTTDYTAQVSSPLLFVTTNASTGGGTGQAPTTSGFRFAWTWGTSAYPDPYYVCVAVFGN